jgi:hypothetical protein
MDDTGEISRHPNLAQDKAKLFAKSKAKPLAAYYDSEEALKRSGNDTSLDSASSSRFAPPTPPVPRFAIDSAYGILNDDGVGDSHSVKSNNHVSISTSCDPTINLADIAMIVDIAGCTDNEAHDALVECFGT